MNTSTLARQTLKDDVGTTYIVMDFHNQAAVTVSFAGEFGFTGLQFHTAYPMFDGQEPYGPCKFFEGAPCFTDGTSIDIFGFGQLNREGRSDEIFDRLESELTAFVKTTNPNKESN